MSDSVIRINPVRQPAHGFNRLPNPNTFNLALLQRTTFNIAEDGKSYLFRNVIYRDRVVANRCDVTEGLHTQLQSGHVEGFHSFERYASEFNLGFCFYWQLAAVAGHFHTLRQLVASHQHSWRSHPLLSRFAFRPRISIPDDEFKDFAAHEQVTQLQQAYGISFLTMRRYDDTTTYKVIIA